MPSRDEIIALYFLYGYKYKLIRCFLYGLHGVLLSLRQVKRVLRRLGLKRRHPFTRGVCEQTVRALGVSLGFIRVFYFIQVICVW